MDVKTIGGNLSQTLYKQNLSTIPKSKNTAITFSNMKSIGGINSIESEDEEMKKLIPVFIEQANLSTWYQNNPWGILTFSNKYGVEPLGGKINLEQPPGYKPGNVLIKSPSVPKVSISKEKFSTSNEPDSSTDSILETTSGKVTIALVVIVAILIMILIGINLNTKSNY